MRVARSRSSASGCDLHRRRVIRVNQDTVNDHTLILPDAFPPSIPEAERTFVGPKDTTRFEGLDLDLNVAGQTLGGSFSFETLKLKGPDNTLNTADDIRVTKIGVTGAHLGLGDGTTDFVSITGGTGGIILGNGGVAASISATISLNVPGAVKFDGTFKLNINTTITAVNETFTVGTDNFTVNVPAGPYLKIEGGTDATPVTLTIAGQTISGKFAFEQYTAPTAGANVGGAKVVRLAMTGVTFHLQAGTTNILSLTNGFGFFVIKPAGLAGTVGGTVTLNPALGLEFTGTLTLAINNSTSAISETFAIAGENINVSLPAGPFVRVEGTGIKLKVAGQTLSGDFAFEQATKAGTTEKITRVIAQKITLKLGDGTTDFLSLTNGSAAALDRRLAGRSARRSTWRFRRRTRRHAS